MEKCIACLHEACELVKEKHDHIARCTLYICPVLRVSWGAFWLMVQVFLNIHQRVDMYTCIHVCIYPMCLKQKVKTPTCTRTCMDTRATV